MNVPLLPGRIEHWPLSRLRPYARNAKTHDADQVAKIAASMAEFGWTVPCLVAADGELIAGHGRVLAAAQLPEAVRARIAGELEDLRQLFAETVAEGRGRRLDTLRALGTEAAVFRGEAAVFAGLADEVADPVTAFRAFAAAPRGTSTLKSNPKGKAPMMTTAPEDHAQPATAPAASTPPEPAAPTTVAPPQTTAAPMSPEAIRAEAAEVAQVCAQAARLGIQIDAADAVAKGVKPEALRAKVLADLAARSDAAGIIVTAPAAGTKESPIVAAAKKSAPASR